MKEQILKLWAEGKNYDEIKEILKCSKGTISYHCGKGQKEKTLHRQVVNRAIKKELNKGKINLSKNISIAVTSKKKKKTNKIIIIEKKHRKYGWTDEEHILGLTLLKEGKNFAEIAKILNKKYRSVKNHYHNRGIKNGLGKIKYIECLECKKIIRKNTIVNGKRTNRIKFCSQKCNGLYYGRKKIKQKPKCINCGKECKTIKSKYCDIKCQWQFNQQRLFHRIEKDDLVGIGKAMIKRYLVYKYGEKCMICGWNERHQTTNKVPIEMNHKDGNSENNSLSNVEIICPNHHSLTLNYKALNKGNGRQRRRQRWQEGKSF